MPNTGVINVLLGNENLKNITLLSKSKWSTHVKRGRRFYENEIYQAYNPKVGEDEIIIVGRWSTNPDWDVRLRIQRSFVFRMNVMQTLIAYVIEDTYGFFTIVTNGFQEIQAIEFGIPANQPKALRDFAEQVLLEMSEEA